MIICEVIRMHVNENMLNEDGITDSTKLDLVARMGGNWYCRANQDSMFEVEKPLSTLGIGVDQIPKRIRESLYLDGNDLGKLGNVERLPSPEEVKTFAEDIRVLEVFENSDNGLEAREALHQYAKELLDNDEVDKAWNVLLCDGLNRV
jgi:hypothetical protein